MQVAAALLGAATMFAPVAAFAGDVAEGETMCARRVREKPSFDYPGRDPGDRVLDGEKEIV